MPWPQPLTASRPELRNTGSAVPVLSPSLHGLHPSYRRAGAETTGEVKEGPSLSSSGIKWASLFLSPRGRG